MWARLKISIKGLWQSGLKFRPEAVGGSIGREVINEPYESRVLGDFVK